MRELLSAIAGPAILGISLLTTCSSAQSTENWIKAIRTSTVWSSFPCKDYMITVACSAAKDNADTEVLPQLVNVGDTIEYTNREGKRKTFRVEAISFFVFDKDVIEKNTILARRGETSCFLFDSTKAFRSQDHLSKIVVKGCMPAK